MLNSKIIYQIRHVYAYEFIQWHTRKLDMVCLMETVILKCSWNVIPLQQCFFG